MKKLALALLLLVLSAWHAHAQQNLQVIGPITPGNVPVFNSPTIVKDGGSAPSPSVTPEQFGCNGNGMFDNTACFAALAAHVDATAPSATINFSPGANYAVWPTDPGSVYLMNFTGTNGLMINFNGAKITSAMTSSAEGNYVLGFTGTNTNITINNPHYEQTAFGNTTPTSAGGGVMIYLSDNATNVIINNAYEIGGNAGLIVVRTASTNRASNIVMNGGYFSSVYYPLAFEKNGDNFTGTGIYATNVGRMYFPYNVKHHNVSFINNYVNNVLPTILLKLYALNTESADLNTLADITVNAQFTSSAALSSGLQYAALQLQQQTSTTAAGIVKDINLHIEAVANSPSSTSIAFDIGKVTSAGAVDSTTRGYVLDNIILSGRFDFGAGNVQTVSAFNTATDGTWTGETVRNIIVRDLVAINSTATNSVVMNLTSLTGPIVFDNVTFDQAISFTGAAANLHEINVIATNNLSGGPDLFGTIAQFGLPGSTQGQVQLCPATGSSCVGLEASSSTASYNFFLPTGAGSNTQVLQSAGSGNPLQWVNDSTAVAGATCTLGSTCGLSSITAALGSDTSLSNVSNYFDGPSVAQGTSGTWFASGEVALKDTAGAAVFTCKLWDGTTLIAAASINQATTGNLTELSLSGILASPAANIKISCNDGSSTSGSIVHNGGPGNTAVLSAIRIN